jgi:hypothetical protein
MAFNPATAKPIESSGFNPATAKPIDSGDKMKELSNVEMMMQRYGVPLLKGAQAIGGFFPTSPLSTGATEAGIKAIQGAKPMEALESGGKAGLADAAMMAATLGASKIPGVKGLVKKGASAAGEFLTGIPKDAYRHILDNPKLLNGKLNSKDAYAKLGKGLSESVEKAEDTFGRNVGTAKTSALKNMNPVKKESITPIIDSLKEARTIYSPKGKISPLDKSDLERMAQIEKALSKNPSQSDISLIVESLRDDLKYGSTRTPTSQQILKKVQSQLVKLLPDDLKAANKQYAELQEMLKDVGERSLGEQNVETLVRNLPNKTLARQEAIQKLGELTGSDIGKQQKDIWSREFFDSLIPAKGYTSGGSQGVGNVARSALLGSMGTAAGLGAINPLALTAGAAFSPLMHKYALKYGVKGLGAARTQAASAIGGQ